jgi:hypothetical protein
LGGRRQRDRGADERPRRIGAHHFGPCAESQENEDACALNLDILADALNPRVAAGTLPPGQPTVPWVVWEEETGNGTHAIFVSRLVGGDHFEPFHPGQNISNRANNASRPDITFAGNVPYISWQEDVGGRLLAFVGHFEGGEAAPRFKLDTPTGIEGSAFGPNVANPLRAPISSGCTANPFNADGASCQGGAVGTPFLLYAAGTPGAQHLFAQAFAPTDVLTLAATEVSAASVTLNGSANPGGAAIFTHFDFGATFVDDGRSADVRLDASSVAIPFDETVIGFFPGDTVHFRVVAKTDFVAVNGPEETFVVANTPPTISIDDLADKVKRKDLEKGRVLTVQLTVSEPSTITLDLLNNKGQSLRQVTLDQTSAGSFEAQISLKRARGKLTLRVTATDVGGASAAVEQQFKAQ